MVMTYIVTTIVNIHNYLVTTLVNILINASLFINNIPQIPSFTADINIFYH